MRARGPVTKACFSIDSAAELLEALPRAFDVAISGRPGPVLVDVPKDVQSESIEVASWPAPGRRARRPAVDARIESDVGRTLAGLLRRLEPASRPGWHARSSRLRAEAAAAPAAGTTPERVVAALAQPLDESATLTTDVGQHQMWVAQAFPFSRPRQLVTSGGLGTMGFGLPAAIGVALAAALGIAAHDVGSPSDAAAAFEAMLARRGPALVRLRLDVEHEVLPMVPPGAANTAMILDAAGTNDSTAKASAAAGVS